MSDTEDNQAQAGQTETINTVVGSPSTPTPLTLRTPAAHSTSTPMAPPPKVPMAPLLEEPACPATEDILSQAREPKTLSAKLFAAAAASSSPPISPATSVVASPAASVEAAPATSTAHSPTMPASDDNSSQGSELRSPSDRAASMPLPNSFVEPLSSPTAQGTMEKRTDDEGLDFKRHLDAVDSDISNARDTLRSYTTTGDNFKASPITFEPTPSSPITSVQASIGAIAGRLPSDVTFLLLLLISAICHGAEKLGLSYTIPGRSADIVLTKVCAISSYGILAFLALLKGRWGVFTQLCLLWVSCLAYDLQPNHLTCWCLASVFTALATVLSWEAVPVILGGIHRICLYLMPTAATIRTVTRILGIAVLVSLIPTSVFAVLFYVNVMHSPNAHPDWTYHEYGGIEFNDDATFIVAELWSSFIYFVGFACSIFAFILLIWQASVPYRQAIRELVEGMEKRKVNHKRGLELYCAILYVTIRVMIAQTCLFWLHLIQSVCGIAWQICLFWLRFGQRALQMIEAAIEFVAMVNDQVVEEVEAVARRGDVLMVGAFETVARETQLFFDRLQERRWATLVRVICWAISFNLYYRIDPYTTLTRDFIAWYLTACLGELIIAT